MDPKPRILVVDDDESVRLSLQLVLQQNGYEVETAATAGEAAQMASARPFHVAVVDIKLPDMDGTQLIALLKERRPETAVIVMTGHASVESAVQALKHDAAAYVIKPANPDELLAEIAESLERRRLVRENRRLLEAAQRELAERERAELALRRSNELLETMFATIHLQIAYLDKDFNFIRVNRAYADAANREPQALVGKNHFDLYPHEHNQAIFQHVVDTGQPYVVYGKPFEHPNRPDEGTTYWDWSLRPIRGAEGQIEGLVLCVLDVSDRKRLENEVLEISEVERRRIGQDLHDTLGQQLAGMMFTLDALAEKLADKALPQAQDARKAVDMLDEAIEHARALARGLFPVKLEDDGLMAALGDFAASVAARYPLECRFECDSPVAIPNHIAATHLYHIAQEAVNNAVKHSEASEVCIRLENSDARTLLAVEDNGTGIPQPLPTEQGMGLRIMEYRAGALGGALQLRPNDRGGTQVICSVPTRRLSAREGKPAHGQALQA